ncbi:MAG TPA: sialidase family protein, partial [Gemmatimonadaceae bacterium]|nr:sialidase family protein [Gemmatimonadaceae bacterium]
GTSSTSFRTNAYPTMVVDGAGRIHVAWAARGYASLRPDPVSGDARIVMTTSLDGVTWSSPQAIDPQPGSGHQFMPALTMAAGRLLLVYYDLREDVSGVFEKYVDEGQIVGRRHTIDVRGAVADPGPAPRFTTYGVAEAVDQPSSEISRYLTGTRFAGADAVTRTLLQFNAPNLKLFSRGRVPFIGDYIDVAAPVFAPAENGQWTFASTRPGPLVVHAIWADNRDVRKPRDGNWENYTPPLPGCTPGQAGVRNQNIYTSRIRPALIVSAPGNAKTLGVIERTFVVQVQNTTTEARTFRLRLPAQPARGRASFRQQDLVTELDATVPRLSSATRTVYVTNSTTTP